MSTMKKILSASVLALALPAAASASSLLETVTLNLGSGVAVSDATAAANFDFNFTNDLSTFDIDRFEITLNVSGIGPALVDGYTEFPASTIGGLAANGFEEGFLASDPTTAITDGTTPGLIETENWFAEFVGGGAGLGSNSAIWARFDPDESPLVPFGFTLTADNDIDETGSDRTDGIRNRAFSRTVNTNQLRMRFRERSGGEDEFVLLSASVSVFEVAPVPVPASGLLLLGAVGGVAAWKRRKSV